MTTIIGVDGEGYDTPDGRHVYVYLCAADEHGKVVTDAYNPEGLSTQECIDCLSKIPKRTLSFGFMFSYDATKILEALTTEQRYFLMRPDLRARGRGKRRWRVKVCGWDFFAGSLSHYEYNHQTLKWRRDFHIWDCFKFFGSSFVKAITDWNIGTPEQRERINNMKSKRGAFEQEDIAEVKAYCQEECVLLAQMMRKLIDAHNTAGIKLRRFDGAGSTAAALLRRENVSGYRNPKPWKKEIERALKAAYFGGRFENSRIGEVKKTCLSRDINSAYPFGMWMLPCLKHGKWSLTKDPRKPELAHLAVCHLHVNHIGPQKIAWMPLPCRTEDGSIVYGATFEGWYHKHEALAAMAGWPEQVKFLKAWVYYTDCNCRPFAWVSDVYQKRLDWGKDGPGIVLKLGLNAGYGKLAQRIGDNPEFASWAWAGAITAQTRATMLSQIGPDRWDVLAIATDGYLCEDNGSRIGDEGKPLGGWDEKEIAEGVVLVKPGLYWRRNAEEAAMRARGIGRRELYKHRKAIVTALAKGKSGVQVKSRRFYGAKQTAMAFSHCPECDKLYPGVLYCQTCLSIPVTTEFRELEDDSGKPVVGTWAERKIDVDFAVTPKRNQIMKGGWLRIVDLGGIESLPYRGETSPEGLEAREAKELALEQADWEE